MGKSREDDMRFALDKESNTILYEGANLSQLSVLFRCDHRTLKERMVGIGPVGKRNGVEIYDISVVASRMGKLTEEQVDRAIHRLNHADLPKTLTKEYWAGQRSKQEFLLKEGALWPTSAVIEAVSEMVKTLKMELDLLTDGIERSSELTEKQREIAMSLVDGAKTNMVKRLNEKFAPKKPKPVLVDDDEL